MKTIEMTRTFHPVGHGAFYTECFKCGKKDIYNIVYDCGCFEAAKEGQSEESYKKRIQSLINDQFSKSTKIDALFISHFHKDHIIGIDYLLKRCKVKRLS